MASTVSPEHDLTPQVAAIQQHLVALDAALIAQDMGAIDACSADLHRTLADALVAFRHAAQVGVNPVSPQLRQTLLLAQARVKGQQASLHQAASSIERTLGLLLPPETASTYSALARQPGR